MSVTEFRRSRRKAMDEVDRGNPVMLTRRGKPSVVLVPYGLWKAMSESAMPGLQPGQ